MAEPAPRNGLPRLAIVGASVRAAAQSASACGFEIVAADLFADQDLRAVCNATPLRTYPSGLLPWLAQADADAWMYTGAMENYPELVDQMAAIKPLWGNAGTPLRDARNPALLRRLLTDAGLNHPPTAPSPAGLPLDGSWLAKTGKGSAGSGVWALDSESSAARAEAVGAEYQQRLTAKEGVPASVIYVLDGSQSETLGVARQFLGRPAEGAGEFQQVGSAAPLVVTAAVEEQLKRLRDLLAGRLRLRGIVGVDLWVGAHQVWVLEVNPRYTAAVQVLESLVGGALLSKHAAVFHPAIVSAGRPQEARQVPAPPRNFWAASKVLCARRDVVINEAFADWAMQHSHESGGFRLADLPAAGLEIAKGQPVLTILVTANEAIDHHLEQRAADVERRLYQGDA